MIKEVSKKIIKDNKFYILLIIFVTIALDGFYFLIKYPSAIDEMTSLAAPLYLNGVDWSDYATLKSKWHGFGTTILVVPFLKIFGNECLYLICQIQCLIFRIVAEIISYILCKNYFNLTSRQSLLIALACNLGILASDDGRVLTALMEIPITLVCLILIVAICKAQKSSFNRVAMSVVCATLLPYTYLLHSRVLLIAVAFFSVVVFCGIVYRKLIISIPVFAISFISIGAFVVWFYNYIDEALYRFAGFVANTNNSGANVVTNHLWKVFALSPEFIKNFIYEFLSLCGSITYYSFGIIWIITIVNLIYILKRLRSREQNIDYLMMTSIFGLVSYWGMNIAFSIKVVTNMAAGDYDILTYLRYSMPFAWIMVLSGFSILLKENINKKMVGLCSISLSLINLSLFWKITIPLLEDSGFEMQTTIFNKLFWYGEGARGYFGKMLFVVVILYIIMFFSWKKNTELMIAVYTLVSIPFMFSALNTYISVQAENVARVDSANKIIKEYTDNIDLYYRAKENGYYMHFLIDNVDSNVRYAYSLEDIDLLSGVLFTDYKVKDTLDDCFMIRLDDNEFLYTENYDVYNKIIEMGY